MKIRKVEQDDLVEIFGWFTHRKWPLPPVESITPADGFLAEEEGVPLACVWVYFTGRSIAFMEWLATNPSVPDAKGMEGLKSVIKGLKDFGNEMSPPVKTYCYFTQNEKLAKHFTKMGFRKQEGYQRLLWTSK
jgi:hypothetical protein